MKGVIVRMRNISDLIEKHLKIVLQQSDSGMIEIQRSELANHFECVPSQINYVISTRFTIEKGYIVESKRGGGGYIRIRKLDPLRHHKIYERIIQLVGEEVTQTEAEGIIYQLEEQDMISYKEARLMRSAMTREVLQVRVPLRDEIRARLLKAMLIVLLQ
jgi:transcriptional regulator CtsR